MTPLQKSTQPLTAKQSSNSLVADTQGKPVLLYHGTHGHFTEHMPGRAGGIYFTPRHDLAKEYGPNIIKAHLNIEKLADLTNPESDAYRLAIQAFNEQGGWSSNEDAMDGRESPYFNPEIDVTWEIFDNPDTNISGVLRAAGYDGVKLQEYNNDVSYVVFQPEQIRPAVTILDKSQYSQPRTPPVLNTFDLDSIAGELQEACHPHSNPVMTIR